MIRSRPIRVFKPHVAIAINLVIRLSRTHDSPPRLVAASVRRRERPAIVLVQIGPRVVGEVARGAFAH